MLPISVKDTVRFTPILDQIETIQRLRDQADEDQREGFDKLLAELQEKADAEPQPVYLIAVATGLQKAAFRRDVLSLGARWPSDGELYETIRRVLRDLEPGNLDALLEIVDQWEEAKASGSVDEDLTERFHAIEQMMLEVPDYARLTAQRTHWMEVAPYVAARHFLVGAENSPVKIKRAGGLVPEATLDKLPPGHAGAIGMKAMSLMSVSETQAKN